MERPSALPESRRVPGRHEFPRCRYDTLVSFARGRRFFFYDRNSSANLAFGFEISQQNDSIAQIGQVDRRLHLSNKAMLRENQKGDDALLIEVREKLMHLQKHEVLFRHRIQEAAGSPAQRCPPRHLPRLRARGRPTRPAKAPLDRSDRALAGRLLRCGSRSIPIPKVLLRRMRRVSSNEKTTAFSPRLSAVYNDWKTSEDLPQPAGPITRVLVPRSSPPPSR